MGQMETVLSADQARVCNLITRRGELSWPEVATFVASLNNFEFEVVDRALARDESFVKALEEYRVERKVVFDKIEAAWLVRKDGLVASTEVVVLENRRQALGA